MGLNSVAVSPPMRAALNAAAASIGSTNPNPCIGAAIVAANGRIATGVTQAVGGAHAEVMALRKAAELGLNTIGATLYVTLEPCSHHGRTGPCCDAVISAGITRVLASMADPNPLVSGQGFAKLVAAGIGVEVGEGAEEAFELNVGFFSRIQRGRPWVRLKVASSLDGITALANGSSQWITGEAARLDGHVWRARACAMLTGIGTVLADDPQLTVRHVPCLRQPIRVIVDSALQTPATATMLQDKLSPVWIYTSPHANAQQRALLEEAGAVVRDVGVNTSGKIDLHALVRDLGTREINEVHVEAGFKLNGSLLDADLVDELLLYQAPILLGKGAGVGNIAERQNLADAHQFDLLGSTRFGPDTRLQFRAKGRLPF